MSFAVLITWFAAVLAGLYMLAVWLIENDVTGRTAAPSRLPVPVVLGHVGLAVTGLALWVAYLVAHQERLAWASIGVLGGIALLGFTMFARWIPVYRDPVTAAGPPGNGGLTAGPAESNFPVAVVAAHGMLAVSTLVLAILATITASLASSVSEPSARPVSECHCPAGRLPPIRLWHR